MEFRKSDTISRVKIQGQSREVESPQTQYYPEESHTLHAVKVESVSMLIQHNFLGTKKKNIFLFLCFLYTDVSYKPFCRAHILYIHM